MKAGNRNSDTCLEAAKSTLRAHPALLETLITLELRDDIVFLDGSVRTHYQKQLAGRLLASLESVPEVVNRLEINRSFTNPFLVKRFYKNKLRRSGLRQVVSTVDGATIWVGGQVDSWEERSAAEQLALTLPGIHTVVNTIRIQGDSYGFPV